MIEVLPVWVVPPDWAKPVLETPEWKTGVLMSETGTEQRMKLRKQPRRRQEFQVTEWERYRGWYDSLMSVSPQPRYYVPWWHETTPLSADVAAGDLSLTVVGIKRELALSKFLFLQGAKPHLYEVVEVSNVTFNPDTTTFDLAANINFSWDAGTQVYACGSAILEQAQSINFDRLGSRAVQGSVRFLFDKGLEWVSALTPPTYRSFPVIELPANYGSEQAGSYQRVLASTDNDIGPALQLDLGNVVFKSFSSSSFVSGQMDNESLKDLLWFLQGKLTESWFVSPQEDFNLVVDVADHDTTLTVERAGYADLTGPIEGRQDIRILLSDGTELYRRITDSTVIDDDTETLTLDSEIISGFSRHDVESISFMFLGRLDQDAVEIGHVTDSEGIASFNLTIRHTPDLRVADDWSPPPLPSTAMTGCGTEQFWLRIRRGATLSPWNGNPAASPTLGLGGLDVANYFVFSGQSRFYYPAGGMNTGTDMAGTGLLFNLTGPFVDPAPFSSAAWGGTMNPLDADPSIQFYNGNEGVYVGAGVTRTFVRSTVRSDAAPGLRYFEITIEALPSLGFSFGFMTGEASLALLTGDITNNAYLFAFPGQYMLTFPPGSVLAAGDVIGMCIFSGNLGYVP